MASGVKSNGVDFDDLFDPDIMGDGPSAPGIQSRGVALRYAALKYGSKRANVGVANASIDVSNLWAAKGSVAYSIAGLQGKHLYVLDGGLTNQSAVSATASITISANGQWSAYGGNTDGAVAQPAPTSGTWLVSGGAASDYQVLIDITSTGSADRVATTSAATWSALTQSRSASLELPPISGNNGLVRDANASVRIRIRRASTGAVVSDTSATIQLRTTGFA